MKHVILLLWLVLQPFSIYSESLSPKQNLNDQFDFVIHTFEPGDRNFETAIGAMYVYDKENHLRSIKYKFNTKVISEKGMVSQEEILSSNGKVEKYIIEFSQEKALASGVDKIVEKTDGKDVTVEAEYYFEGKVLFRDHNTKILDRFPFYTIGFIQRQMSEGFVDRPNKKDYGFSAKYVSSRSMVKFVESPVDIDEVDRDFLITSFGMRGDASLAKLYSKKVLVQENDKSYYMLFQDSNLQYIKPGNRAAVYYYIGLVDDRLELASVGFSDIK